jgi:putative hemolysin
MELINPQDLILANPYLKFFGGEPLARWIFRLLKLDWVNETYSKSSHLHGSAFAEALIEQLKIRFEISGEDLEKFPAEGGFITVSNHPYGGLDGIFLLKTLPQIRPDYKIIVNFLLTKLIPFREYFVGVNPFETYKDAKSSFGGLKDAFLHLSGGHPLGIFPAGEVSTYQFNKGCITDKEWQYSILKFIKKVHVPVVPVYFNGHNSALFHFLGMIHPVLRTVKLASEIKNKQGRTIKIRVGQAIPVKEQDEFRDVGEYGKFLRMQTYNLGLDLRKTKIFPPILHSVPEKIISPIDPHSILNEIESLKSKHLLFNIKENYVFCVPTPEIPNIMTEIGRLRESTYREVGEGTNKSVDIDAYDSYFEQLFIWDDRENQIIGGYRVGKGDQILISRGIEGFYIHSLFRIQPALKPILGVSMELGRSFIVRNYQKKALSLFLLWKGILYLLLKNPEYRYLIGPVSISNEFSECSKSLVVEFLKRNYFNSEIAEYVRSKKKFIPRIDKSINKEILHRYTEKNITRLDRLIQDIDPAFKTPILLKKYISVNAEIAGFNIDQNFNNCLDALMILDLFEVPFETIESLSKEFNDQSILDRFKK